LLRHSEGKCLDHLEAAGVIFIEENVEGPMVRRRE
jgi:hypothetical protein